ncbi:MAG: hypothetical protein DRN49_03625 [Thaumarchaeota archaeon]|nr:MAG: hypothetical protein DRN49_03625 [Nitrososphaerota archaeon]
MGKVRQFDELEDKSVKELVSLAHNVLEKIKQIAKEKSGGADNIAGFLGFTLSFCIMLQGLALQEGADMAQTLVSRLMEKMKARGEIGYVV